MKFSTKEDIEAPAEVVFDALSDFPRFERAAMRRGAEVTRIDRLAGADAGLSWSVRFPLRGRVRRLVCDLKNSDRPNAMLVGAESSGFSADLTLTLLALSRSRTRLGVELEIKPKGLSSRLMLQTARLGKANLSRRFVERVQKFAANIELQHLRHRID
ncbi:MAG: SRPBCC family protein [Rhodobacteraceae bacterium]|nr:SRPBCC family protein [Paracoccaceae bacterium]